MNEPPDSDRHEYVGRLGAVAGGGGLAHDTLASVGAADAEDEDLHAWAAVRKHVILTNDLDFGTLLALTHALEPSVFLVRAQRVLPEHLGTLVLSTLRRYEAELASGAIVVLEESKSRVRVLPF